MQKPIIATTLSGLFIKSDPWKKAHIIWFEDAARKLSDPSIKLWANKTNYFDGVDIVMKKLYPKLSDKERVIKARETYFDSIIKYIEANPGLVNIKVVEYFRNLKKDYLLILITTNEKRIISKLLSLIDLNNFFDTVEASEAYERDDKTAVFRRFIKNYGKPLVYIGGDKKDSFDFCLNNKIDCIFANFEKGEEIRGVKCVYTLKDLSIELEKILKKDY